MSLFICTSVKCTLQKVYTVNTFLQTLIQRAIPVLIILLLLFFSYNIRGLVKNYLHFCSNSHLITNFNKNDNFIFKHSPHPVQHTWSIDEQTAEYLQKRRILAQSSAIHAPCPSQGNRYRPTGNYDSQIMHRMLQPTGKLGIGGKNLEEMKTLLNQ